MNVELWRIYDKSGSNLNLFGDAYLNLVITDTTGKDAAGYAITDPSTQIVGTYITNSGFEYTNPTIQLDYTFSDDGLPFDMDSSVVLIDVSIFNPEGQNSNSIGSITIDDSTNYIYPGVTYAGALFLTPVSQGLIETEHLTIFQDDPSNGYITPFDTSNGTLVFKMSGDEEVIKFFTLDDNTQEITWADELIFDVSTFVAGRGLQINLGFKSDEEGVYERKMIVYHRINNENFALMELVINAESIGRDERLDTLLDNFGLYKPESFPQLFKEVDINEDLPDWKILNYKGKHMILEHNKIMPYIGTYKALINAIKWLGYDDISVKEWFKDVKENTKLSLYVPYDADERKKTIKYFTPEERRNLKKLNQLSLVYCINQETDDYDEWGTPETENCYEYNLNEILIKLFALKKWLEKNIIGVNARIWDLTGEGIYFERFANFIYGTQNIGTNANYVQSLTPDTVNEDSELVTGDASMLLTLKEYNTRNTLADIQTTIIEMARYGWDPSNGFFSPEDYYDLSYVDPSAVFIGAPFGSPFKDLYDIQWKISVDKSYAGVVVEDYVTRPIFIRDNEIRFYNYFDSSSRFFDVSANVDVTIEKGYLRDPSIDTWEDSIDYTIYQEEDASGNNTGKWIFESSTGTIQKTWGQFSLQTDTQASLTYEIDDNYKVPLFKIDNYKWTDSSGITNVLDRDYYLDIVDGKIAMDGSTSAVNGDWISIENFINFNYDTSLDEQSISLIVTYTSPRMAVFNFDPSDASTLYYSGGDAGFIVLAEDNSIYQIDINHAGSYEIEIYGWNGQNNLFFNFDRNGYDVWQKHPTISSYIDTSCAGNIERSCTSTYLTNVDISALIDQYPIFDRIIPLQGLSLEYDVNNNAYVNVPSITFFQDLPAANSLSRFYNLTERATGIAGSIITIDKDYQDFLGGDDVQLVLFDKGKYSFITEASSHVTTVSGSDLTLDYIPPEFAVDVSNDVYVLNDTNRWTANPSNNYDTSTFVLDISGYVFDDNQMVGIIVADGCTGYTWGSSYRVVSTDGSIHTFDNAIPEFLLDGSRYTMTAKHAFSTYADYQIDISTSSEVNNNFKLYLDDTYNHQYYLDNTFVFVSIDFDQDQVLQQWYDASTDEPLSSEYYPFNHSIELDVSTLVILRAEYDSSNYMLDQKNIWTIVEHESSTLILEVFNDSVAYIFDAVGEYDIKTEAYDSYGNLETKLFEGLIKISDGS